MNWLRRIMFSEKASDRADRMQFVMLVVMAVSHFYGAPAIAIIAFAIFVLAWMLEIICLAIEQLPTIVVVRDERER